MIEVLIIEDEMPAAQRLRRMLEELDPSIRILGILESVSASVSWLSDHSPPDLLMLDIQLADGLSFDIFKKIHIDSFVIFTTAYDEYAIKAFELNSIDYLLKPVDKVKMEHALEKYKKISPPQRPIDIQALMEAMDHSRKRYKERFAVNVGTRIKSIETSQIAYFYSLEKSTFLCTVNDRHYPVDFALDKLEEVLDPSLFFRISRQYTVNYHSIDRINILSKSRVALHTKPPTKEPLLVSTARTHQFRQWLDR
jgi:DNA-binding LytR/AlgR family response regulator